MGWLVALGCANLGRARCRRKVTSEVDSDNDVSEASFCLQRTETPHFPKMHLNQYFKS